MEKEDNKTIEALAKLRKPFPKNQISLLPKPTKSQTDAVKRDFQNGIRCTLCGGWHHPKVVHLDYVGHAALTLRLLDVDPFWNWEPVHKDEHGVPQMIDGGMWIKLTVCGVTRLGYGDAQGKKGHNAIKETIGDALRNAAMRFGAALDLWSKADLHRQVEDDNDLDKQPPKTVDAWEKEADKNAKSIDKLRNWYEHSAAGIKQMPESDQKKVNSYVSQLKEILEDDERQGSKLTVNV